MKSIDYEKTIKNIREKLRNYLTQNKLKSMVIGVSGGADSALVCALAYPVAKELGIQLIGRSITIESNKQDEIERARGIGKYFCTDFLEIDLSDKYRVMREMDEMEGEIDSSMGLDIAQRIRMGNIKARMRMIYLYNLASKNKGLVLSTDNFTEYMVGFWTLHGDVGDYGMIQELWKTEVYGMIEWISNNELFFDVGYNEESINSLSSMLDAVATDGLGITNSDLDQLLPNWKEKHTTTRQGYEEVDNILFALLSDKDNYIITNHPVINRHYMTHFKRENPLNLKRSEIVVNLETN